MKWWDSFRKKPRDGAVVGLPVGKATRLGLFSRNRTTQSTGIEVWAYVYRSEWDDVRPLRAVGPFNTANTDFSSEAPQSSIQGLFSDGDLLCAVAVTSDSITDPTQLWAAVILTTAGTARSAMMLCEGYIHGSNVVGWTAGGPIGMQAGALSDPGAQGALFVYHATITNDAGAAGDHVYQMTLATGSRAVVIAGWLLNGDTANRVATALVTVGGDVIDSILGAEAGATVNAGVENALPASGAGAGVLIPTANRAPTGPVYAAPAILTVTLAAVAASENSRLKLLLLVWGGAPTFTEAGGTAAVAVVEQERFLAG